MVTLVGKVSKGSVMDQIYVPKKRAGFPIGSYVVIKPLETKPEKVEPFFYNIKYLEPVKVEMIKEIFENMDEYLEPENIIITGSFLDKGFRFNDIDVIVINEKKLDVKYIKELLENKLGANLHLISITNKALIKGLSTDPLYKVMLSRCVSKKRIIYKSKVRINYKLLDLHLLKSKLLIDNFDFLGGDEKYGMVRNLIAIDLFINKKQVTKVAVDSAINNLFGSVEKLKNNLVSRKSFLDKYMKIYIKVENKILKAIENESKQK